MDPQNRQQTDHLGTLQPMVMRVCQGEECGVRFPVAAANPAYELCHLCQQPTIVTDEIIRHDATQPGSGTRGLGHDLRVVCDNVRSALNVGTIIRTADGAGFSRVYVGGISPAIDNPKVLKTSLGAEEHLSCSHHPNLIPLLKGLQSNGALVWALEFTPTSIPLRDVALPVDPAQPVIIVVGNEVAGVDPAILTLADRHVHLPMRGTKNSLNVAVAFGALAYSF